MTRRLTAPVLALALLATPLAPASAAPPLATGPASATPAGDGAQEIPEPSDLGSQGRTYVSPTGPPVTDIVEERRLGTAAAESVYPCQAYGTVPRWNPVEQVADDVFAFDTFPPYRVGDGKGDIDWELDPFRSTAWNLWFASLRWLGSSIEAGRAGDDAALAKAETVVRDWLADNGTDWVAHHDNIEANTHRLNTLICLREVVVERNDGRLPDDYDWLTRAIVLHAEHNVRRWSGATNHGSMENRALLGTGCLLGRRDFQQTAVDRVGKAFTTQVDAQGMSNEASSTYALFNYNLFSDIRDLMNRCGWRSSSIDKRLELMGTAVAHMVSSTGHYHQYGDTEHYRAQTWGSSAMEYAGSDGSRGTAPKDRVRMYSAGYVFGRSSWGSRETGFRDEASWMLRGGTGNEHKANRGELLQLLYTARGRDVVIDGGHPGVENDVWRKWADSEVAHNTIYVPTTVMSRGGRATVTRSSLSADGSADFVEMSQQFSATGHRTRGVLIAHDPDFAVVLDRTRITDPATTHTVQTLWTMPADQVTTRTSSNTVVSRAPGSATRTTIVHLPFTGRSGTTSVVRGRTSPFPQGHWFPRPRERHATDQVVTSKRGNSVDLLSIIVPAPARDEVRVLRSTYADGATKLTIRIGDQEHNVRVTAGGWLSRDLSPAMRWSSRVRVGHGWPEGGEILDGGDVDGDGRPDIFLRRADGTLWFIAGRAGGRWASARQVGRGWTTMTWVDTGVDLTGDGVPDMLARDTAGRLYRYTGRKDGTFHRPVRVGHGWNTRRNIAMYPAGGGRPTTVTGVDPEGYLHAYTVSGGVVTRQVRLGRGWSAFRSVSGFADVTGDGVADMFAVTGTGELRVYPGRADGDFRHPASVGHGWQAMRLPVAGTGRPGTSNHLWAVDASGVLWRYPFTWRG